MKGRVNPLIARTREANLVAASTFWTLTADICPPDSGWNHRTNHRHIPASLHLHLNAATASWKTNEKGNLPNRRSVTYHWTPTKGAKIVLFFRLSHPTLQPFTPTLWEAEVWMWLDAEMSALQLIGPLLTSSAASSKSRRDALIVRSYLRFFRLFAFIRIFVWKINVCVESSS